MLNLQALSSAARAPDNSNKLRSFLAGETSLLTEIQQPLAHILYVDATVLPYSSTLQVS
jgi:hypothetical protein